MLRCIVLMRFGIFMCLGNLSLVSKSVGKQESRISLRICRKRKV